MIAMLQHYGVTQILCRLVTIIDNTYAGNEIKTIQFIGETASGRYIFMGPTRNITYANAAERAFIMVIKEPGTEGIGMYSGTQSYKPIITKGNKASIADTCVAHLGAVIMDEMK